MPLKLTCDTTQRIVLTAFPDGDFTGESLAGVVVSGDATVSNLKQDGTPYPPNQVAVLAGPTTGDTVFTIEGEGMVKDEAPDQVVLTVTLPLPKPVTNLGLVAGPPEPK